MKRRTALAWPALWLAAPAARAAMQFPRDHGAPPAAALEWWYATGWLGREDAPSHGFQITFFRSRTGLGEDTPGRFAPRQLLFAHAAVTDLAAQRHRHAQRLGRWDGRSPGRQSAALDDTDVRLGDWRLRREGAGYRAQLAADAFALDLQLTPTQPPLLQGPGGVAPKDARPGYFSHYYSEPQLEVRGRIARDGALLRGRAWLDREWSDGYLPPDAVGWDWVAFNLFDGSALMALRMRRADGSASWHSGSLRSADGRTRLFAPDEVVFTPGRSWTSPANGARYPVQWQLQTPAGRWTVNALLDAQELDSRANTGAVYWEGLSELRDGGGRRVGLGYLEMTGYAAPLRM